MLRSGGQRIEARIAGPIVDFPVVGIDQKQLTRVAGIDASIDDAPPIGAGLGRCADDRDRRRAQQGIEPMRRPRPAVTISRGQAVSTCNSRGKLLAIRASSGPKISVSMVKASPLFCGPKKTHSWLTTVIGSKVSPGFVMLPS